MCVIEKPNEVNDEIELVTLLEKDCKIKNKPVVIEECKIDLSKCKNQNNTQIQPHWITEDWNRVYNNLEELKSNFF